jgi:hypothetical protein
MSPTRKRLLAAALATCFLTLIVASAVSGRPVNALVFAGLGLLTVAVHGVAATSKARLPLFVASGVASLAGIGLMLGARLA